MKSAGGVQKSHYGKRIQLARFLKVVTGFRPVFTGVTRRNDGIISFVLGLKESWIFPNSVIPAHAGIQDR